MKHFKPYANEMFQAVTATHSVNTHYVWEISRIIFGNFTSVKELI